MENARRKLYGILKDDSSLTPFQRRVYAAVSAIPAGRVRSYKWVAEKIGSPGAFRAVGQALKKNSYMGIVPCHRVIKSDGSLGGFSRGKRAKARLLASENADYRGYFGRGFTRMS